MSESHEKLKTKNIFLDTSIFVNKGFNFTSEVFKRLTKLVDSGDVKLYVTEIVKKEVEKKVREKLTEAISTFESAQNKTYILKNIRRFTAHFEIELDDNEIEEELVGQFQQYLRDAKAISIPLDIAKQGDVFKKYYCGEVPFDQSKKKNEFPDAFSFSALHEFVKKENFEIYVISSDDDYKRMCAGVGSLHYLSKLEEYFDLLEREQDTFYAFLEAVLGFSENKIKTAISQEFQQHGFYLDDRDGEVNEVDVINVDIYDYLITDMDDEIAKVTASVCIEYKADVTYDDYDSAIYDSEEKRYMFINEANHSVDRQVDFDIDMEFEFNKKDDKYLEIINIDLGPKDIAVTIDEDDYR